MSRYLNEKTKSHLNTFRVSDIWISSFVQRNGLESITLHEPADIVDKKVIVK